jgi:hypothetical protein
LADQNGVAAEDFLSKPIAINGLLEWWRWSQLAGPRKLDGCKTRLRRESGPRGRVEPSDTSRKSIESVKRHFGKGAALYP